MAIDPRKRQKKLERRKANDKAEALARRKQVQKVAAKALEAIPRAPILHCCLTEELWEDGIGQVIVSRQLPNGQVAFAVFLLDAYCLGVKNVMFNIAPPAQERQIFENLQAKFSLVKIEPHCARKLVEGGVEYAQSLGFPPHPDYSKARLIFGDVDPSACEREFQYGKDGKPYFFAGPRDGPEKSSRIIHMLHNRCGADGFHYFAPLGTRFVTSQAEPNALEDHRES